MSLDLHDFCPGMRVRYVPGVAAGDERHAACEDGVVTSIGAEVVFVRYDGELNSKATSPQDLRLWTR